MKNNNIVINILKGVSLLIFDMVTLMLVFSVWVLVNIPLFPWALCTILLSLIMVNISVLSSKKITELFGVGIFVSSLVSTLLYYIFVMAYTGIRYIAISPKWYIVTMLIATLIYIAIIAGLYISGINKNKDLVKQETEQSKVLNINIQLMEINENIKSGCDFLGKESYNAIIEAFNDMHERLKASTPFGRTTKPIAVNLENQIALKLNVIGDNVISLKSPNDNQATCKLIIDSLNDVKSLIINREKLLLQ